MTSIKERGCKMDKLLFDGYEQIEKHFGGFPSFHDDVIESILITKDQIEMIIKENVYCDDKKEHVNGKVKLSFINAKSFQLQGALYGTVSIILDLIVTKKDNMIETQLETSLGTEGIILSGAVGIDVVK